MKALRVVVFLVLVLAIPAVWLNTGKFQLYGESMAWRDRVDEAMRARNPAWIGAGNNRRLVDLKTLGVDQEWNTTVIVRESEMCQWDGGQNLAQIDWLSSAAIICRLDYEIEVEREGKVLKTFLIETIPLFNEKIGAVNLTVVRAYGEDEGSIESYGLEGLVDILEQRGTPTTLRLNVRRLVFIPLWIP